MKSEKRKDINFTNVLGFFCMERTIYHIACIVSEDFVTANSPKANGKFGLDKTAVSVSEESGQIWRQGA